MMEKLPETIKKGEITLKKGIDKSFYLLLFKLYKPFLGNMHLKDKYQYSIFLKGKLVGFIQVGGKPANFVQTALIPGARNKGSNLGKKVKTILMNEFGLEKLGFSSDKSNYPSLKSFYDFGGGVFDSACEAKRKKVEGFCCLKNQNQKMRQNLFALLPEVKNNYSLWLKEYNKRSKELKSLEEYLKIKNK